MRGRSLFMLFLSCVLCLFSVTTSVNAQDNVELMRKLYAKLSELLTVDSGSLQRSGTYLILAPTGGYLLDSRLDADTNPDHRRIVITNFMDIRMQESWILSRVPDPMSTVYRAVLRDSTTPNFFLSAEEQKQYQDIDDLLFEKRPKRKPTDLLQTFRDAETVLINAMGEVQTWQRANPGKPLPNTLRQQLKRATDEYNNDAQGPYVRELQRKYVELQRKRSAGWLSDSQEIFAANFNAEGNYGNVDFYPSYAAWLDRNHTWTTLTASASDLQKQTHNSQTSFSGGLSASWGLFRIGGNYDKDEELKFQQSQTSNLTISFEVLQVSLRYPWMTYGVFESGAWDWSKSALYYGSQLSNGVYDPERASTPGVKKEILPFAPTTLIVVKNVKLKADWGFDMENFVRTREQKGGSFGWGPFSLGGRSSSDDTRTYKVAKAQGTEVSFNEPQIIGYFAYMLPDSPHRDTSLPWPEVRPALAPFFAGVPIADPVLEKAMKTLEMAP